MQPTDHDSSSQDGIDVDFLNNIASDQNLGEWARLAPGLKASDDMLARIDSTPVERRPQAVTPEAPER